MPSPRRSPLQRLFAALTDNIVLRVTLYYALLFGGVALAWPHVSPTVRDALLKSVAPNFDVASVSDSSGNTAVTVSQVGQTSAFPVR
jgi:hypothetical protein